MRILFLVTLVSLSISFSQETLPLTTAERTASITQNLRYESDDTARFQVYRGFIVQFNCQFKTPNFTIHHLSFEQISPDRGPKARRRSSFFVDQQLDSCSSTNQDFKGSGFDKGHLVPAGDFYWNQLLKNESFVLSNVSPQAPSLNRGIWARLEEAIRARVLSSDSEAYVVTGVIHHPGEDEMGGRRVGIPSFFYKIIYFPRSQTMSSYLFTNGSPAYSGSLSDFLVKEMDIERITGEDFFDRLDDTLEVRLKSQLVPTE